MNENTYDLNSGWYTELSKNPVDIEKILLILESLKINNYEHNVQNLLTKKWLGLSHDKILSSFTSAITPVNFKISNYNYIPFEYLLTL